MQLLSLKPRLVLLLVALGNTLSPINASPVDTGQLMNQLIVFKAIRYTNLRHHFIFK